VVKWGDWDKKVLMVWDKCIFCGTFGRMKRQLSIRNGLPQGLAVAIVAVLMALASGQVWAQESLYTPWSVGITAGLGGIFPTSSLSDNFKACVTFNAGLEAQYRALRIKGDVAFGQPSLKNNNIYNVLDDQGRDAQINSTASASMVLVDGQLGYTVLRHGRLSITPCAGVSWSRIGWNVNDITWGKDDAGVDVFTVTHNNSTSLSNVSWIASVDFDIRLHTASTDMHLLGERSALVSSVRITPYITHASYDKCSPAVSGNYIGLKVCYSGLLRGLNY